jgi:hypothetical protein
MSSTSKVGEMLLPRVRDRLAEAEANRDRLAQEVEKLALPAALDEAGATSKLAKVEREHAAVITEVERLKAAQREAERRDHQTAAEGQLAEMRQGLAEFERLMTARTKAAAAVDSAVTALAEAAERLRAGGLLIESMIPAGLMMPRGYLRKNLRRLIAHALYKGSAVTQIGDPVLGGAPPNFESQFSPGLIPTTEEIISEECGWLMQSLEAQIARVEQEVEAA